MTRGPRVSAVMAVRDGARYLEESLDSLLHQTLRDIEVVVIDDGSTDSSAEIVGRSGDPRIRLERQPRHGLVPALNRAVEMATGSYVARMDADDVSLPGRLARQAAFLDAHPEVAVVGSSFELMDQASRTIRVEPTLTEDGDLRRDMLVRNPFGHGSVMVRRANLVQVGGYSSAYEAAEDFDLWRRLATVGRLASLPAVLYRWRVHPGASSVVRLHEQTASAQRILDELWQQGRPDPLTRAQLRRRARRYADLGPDLGPLLAGRFRHAELTIGLKLVRRGHLADGCRQLANLELSGVGAVAASAIYCASGARVASWAEVERRLLRPGRIRAVGRRARSPRV